MNIKKGTIIRLTALLLALFIPYFSVNAEEKKGTKKTEKASFTVLSESSIGNDLFIVEAQGVTGAFSLTDKRTGVVWYSNPADRDAQTDVKGINKMQMNSQLIVEYLVDKKNTKQATSFASSTNKKGIKVTVDKNGLRIDYNFVSEKFSIPLLLTLDKNGLIASVLCDEIKESGENQITKISLLPYFGAAGKEDNGYFLVPDGSGALINFNNGKTGSNYQQEIYDTDGLMNIKTNKTVTQKARLPIFGIENGTDTMLSVIDGGATVCRLYSYVSGSNGNYNIIYPQFTYRQSSVVSMLSKTWYPVDVTFISSRKAEENFSVCYMPLDEDNGGYSDMAAAYREKLVKDGMFTKKTEKSSVPLFLDIYGSAMVSDNILGIPVTVNKSLTSFKEAKEILKKLQGENVDGIFVRYLGISSSGLVNKKVPTSFKAASSLGGKKGFKELISFADKAGINIYPDVDLINFTKPTFSLIKQLDAAKDVCDKTGVFYEFEASNGEVKTGSKKSYVLKPHKVEKAAEKYITSYKKITDNKYLAPSTLGNFIYSDFDDNICLAQDTAEKFTDLMNGWNDDGISLMLESPNAYALGCAQSVVCAPINSSNFDIEDASVPFYQMVLHGYIAYSVPSINLSVDNSGSVLKAIETGSSLMYSLSKADYSVLCYDDYDHLYSITAKNWLKDIYKDYEEVKNALSSVSQSVIVRHEAIQNDVFKTVYENGVSIIVNYGEAPVEIDGKTVEANNYLVIMDI